MKRFVIPKKVRVGGLYYDVIYPYVFSEQRQCIGLHKGLWSEIYVASKDEGFEMSKDKIIEAYVHELVHAIDFVYTNCSLRENSVVVIARALIEFFKYNDFNIEDDIIPNRLKIFTNTFNVTSDYKFTEGKATCASLFPQRSLILVESQNLNPYTVKHSVFECCFLHLLDVYMIEDKELIENDIFICAFAAGAYQVFKDNKIERLIKDWM